MAAASWPVLASRTILIARDIDRAAGLRARLESLGATVLVSPVTTVVPENPATLAAAMTTLTPADWVVVTSATAAAVLSAAADHVGTPLSDVPAHWAAVGPATRDALEAFGVRVDLEPAEHSAAGLVVAFAALDDICSSRVLLPQSELAASTLAVGLSALGYEPQIVTAYRTVPVKVANAVKEAWHLGTIDAVVLTAGSSARQVVAQLGVRSDVMGIAIGTSTAQVARQAGLRIDAVATAATDAALADAVVTVLGGPVSLR